MQSENLFGTKSVKHRAYRSWQLVFRNPADFTKISPVKSTQNLIKASVSAKTLQFDECRVGAMTKDFMKSAGFQNYELLRDDQV